MEVRPDFPLGMFSDSVYSSTCVELVPGDRVVLVTDGMLERNVARVDLPAALADMRSLHPREAVRAMADKALQAAGHELADDATVLCLDWHGDHELHRASIAGAEPSRAGDPSN